MKTKQIAKLKSIAANLKPVLQVGKYGIHENVIIDICDYLNAHEIMKISLLKNTDVDLEAFKALLISKGITIVSKIGRTMTLYRYSNKLKEHIEL